MAVSELVSTKGLNRWKVIVEASVVLSSTVVRHNNVTHQLT